MFSEVSSRRDVLKWMISALTVGLQRTTEGVVSAATPIQCAERLVARFRNGGLDAFLATMPARELERAHAAVMSSTKGFSQAGRLEFATRLGFESIVAFEKCGPQAFFATFLRALHDDPEVAEFGTLLATETTYHVKITDSLTVEDRAFVSYRWVDQDGDCAEMRFAPRLFEFRRVDGEWTLELNTGPADFLNALRAHEFACPQCEARVLGVIESELLVVATRYKFATATTSMICCAIPSLDDDLQRAFANKEWDKLNALISIASAASLEPQLRMLKLQCEIEDARGDGA